MVLLATKAFKTYQNATGAIHDEVTNLYTITVDQFHQLQNLTFTISDVCILNHGFNALTS
jgi:cathepsin E